MATPLTETSAGRIRRGLMVLVCCASLAAGCAGSQSRQSTGDFVDDTVVSTKVKTALIQDDQVDALDVQIKTFKGVVQLSGFADTQREKERAGSIAGRVAGVERVRNDIRIKD